MTTTYTYSLTNIYFTMKFNELKQKIKRWCIITVVAFFGSSILAVVAYKYVPVPCSPSMFVHSFQRLFKGESPFWHHTWVPLTEMSPEMPLAVWATEDQKFLDHNGFDIEQIENAIKEHESGHRNRGGSTISQQTAKNVFLWPSTPSLPFLNWTRKGFEAYFTLLIETIWSKQRIMEVYLNTIEMGKGIYGAEAVANEHFGVNASQLTRNQCALIAVSLPNPIRFDSSNPTSYMYKRQLWAIKQMRWLKKFPMEDEQN